MSADTPALTLITPELPAEQILMRAQAALEGASAAPGVIALQLRARHLEPGALRALGASLRELTARHGARLLVNGDLELAASLAADGVQLPERGPGVQQARTQLGPRALVGASRHDAAGVAAAARDGATFALLSPVYEVPGKGPPLGLDGFGRIARASAIPVIALGGVRAENAPELLAAGAAGVAVIREVFEAADPALATARLLAALTRHG